MSERKRYTPDMLNKAKQLYMAYKTADTISKETGIEINSVIYYTKTQWKAEREALNSQSLVKIQASENREERINSMVNNGLSYLEKSLNGLISSDIVEPAAMKSVADIILKLKQIKKMDEGTVEAEEGKYKPASVDEMKALFSKDPFNTQEPT